VAALAPEGAATHPGGIAPTQPNAYGVAPLQLACVAPEIFEQPVADANADWQAKYALCCESHPFEPSEHEYVAWVPHATYAAHSLPHPMGGYSESPCSQVARVPPTLAPGHCAASWFAHPVQAADGPASPTGSVGPPASRPASEVPAAAPPPSPEAAPLAMQA
jgi:hypothetical protein